MFKARFAHLCTTKDIFDFYVDGEMVAENVLYTEVTAFFNIKNLKTKSKIAVKKAGDPTTTVAKISLNLRELPVSTVVVFKHESEIMLKVLDSKLVSPNIGHSMLRVFNFAENMASFSVYVDKKSVFQNVKYSDHGTPLNREFSLYRGQVFHNVQIMNAITNNLLFEKQGVHMRSGNIYSIFVCGNGNNATNNYKYTILIIEDNPGIHDVLQKNFDPQKYMNSWFQIARIPQFFENGLNCFNQTAQYTLLHDKVKVFNSCIGPNGEVIRTATGEAIIEDNKKPAALTVSFPGYPESLALGPNYLIHDTDYTKYAIVGSSDRSGLYILCRKKKMREKMYSNILDFCKKLNYDVKKLKVDSDTIIH